MSIQHFAHFKIGLSDFPHARRKWRWRRGGAPGGWEVRRWRPLRAGRRPGVRTAGELAGGQRPPWADGWTRWVPRPPGSRACSFQSAGPALPGSGAYESRTVGLRPGRVTSRTSSSEGILSAGVAARTSPPESAPVSGKAAVFRSGLSCLFMNSGARDRWFACFIFITLKKKPVHHCLCFPQWINFVVSCYLFIALN